ncbi:MAG: DUF4333 domain-containing protein [Actinobacteria bacterium]|nr:MAG: DUF4333 domain-containing protein [Actinomycetota bacterium]
MRRMINRAGVVVALGVSVGAATGCQTTIDQGKAENLVKKLDAQVPGPRAQKVTCPSGVKAKAGGTFTCTLTYANGEEAQASVHMTDSSGHVTLNASDVHQTKAPGAAGGKAAP